MRTTTIIKGRLWRKQQRRIVSPSALARTIGQISIAHIRISVQTGLVSRLRRPGNAIGCVVCLTSFTLDVLDISTSSTVRTVHNTYTHCLYAQSSQSEVSIFPISLS